LSQSIQRKIIPRRERNLKVVAGRRNRNRTFAPAAVAIQGIESKQNLTNLPPQSRFVTAQPVEGAASLVGPRAKQSAPLREWPLHSIRLRKRQQKDDQANPEPGRPAIAQG
jgi:hypothetical protein